MKAIKTITKTYKGETFTFQKDQVRKDFKVTSSGCQWYQSTPSVKEAFRRLNA